MNKLIRFGIVSVLAAACSAAIAQDKPAAGAAEKPAAKQDAKPEAKPAAKTDEKKADASTPRCAVMMDDEIDMNVFATYRGKKVYFCCEKCKAKFETDPDKYAENVKKQWDAMRPLRVQVKCAISGEDLSDLKTSSESKDGKVYFCCDKCKSKWDKDAAMHAKLGEACTFQTTCPMDGNAIDPLVHKDYDGKRVYFCCAGCPAAFEKEKAVGMRKVDEIVKANMLAYARQAAAQKTEPAKKDEPKKDEPKKEEPKK